MLGRLSITQKLAAAVVAPLVALGGLSLTGFVTFNRVKVNGPEYRKLATTSDLVADILPPPAFILESHFIAQSMLQADSEEFPGLLKQEQQLQAEFDKRYAFWKANLSTIGEPALVDPFLNKSKKAADEYFAVFSDEFVPNLRSAYARGWNPDETQIVVNEPAVKAQRIFETELTPLYQEHRAAIDKTVQIANTRRSNLESSVSSSVSRSLLGLGLIALLGAIATFLLTTLVARAIRRPIKQLTDAANRAATEDLPLLVAAAQAGEDSGPTVNAMVQVESDDEIAELASAFASMQSTAVGLAREQALVRRNVSENLVNLARRNQSLLGRSLQVLTKLEQDEPEEAKLADLFKVDHLTTRMRRNAESLLVLAGAEPNRKWSAAVEMGDVVRAAVSAIESFDRVDIVGLDDVKVRGSAVNDLAHLLAELIENATNFSPPDSRVTVVGKGRPDGYLLVVTDTGIGMSEDDLHAANARIASTTTFESTPTKVLGLNVVGRLANRYGIDVTLATSTTAGVAARIQVPVALLETSDAQPEITPADSVLVASGSGSNSFDSGNVSDTVGTVTPVETAEASANVPDWLQNVTGVSMDSTAPINVSASTGDGEDTAEDVASSVPDNVRLLRRSPAEDKPSGLKRRIKGAQIIESGVTEAKPTGEADRAGSVMSSLSRLQQGLARGRSVHPSELPGDEATDTVAAQTSVTNESAVVEADLVSHEAVQSDIAVGGEPPAPVMVSAASDRETAEQTETALEPSWAEQPAPALPVGTGEHGELTDLEPTELAPLVKRVRGAQMVDTGPVAVVASFDDGDDSERAEHVKRSLTGLQRGMERGRALDSNDLPPTMDLPASNVAEEVSAHIETTELAAAGTGLRRRVKGAQMPVTQLPTATATATPTSSPDAVRSAFGSLQRGVDSARQAIAESAEHLGDSANDESSADPSTLSAHAPTH